MKRFFISVVFIGSFGAYALYNYFATNAATTLPQVTAPVTTTDVSAPVTSNPATPVSTTPVQPSNPTPVPTPTPVPVPVPVKKPTGQYTDGTYTGSVADAYYGNVQVRVTVSGGKITNVAFIQYPNDRSTSISINRRAMPILSAEAIQAQSANVDGVSGASDTSAAFVQSLSAALFVAKA